MLVSITWLLCYVHIPIDAFHWFYIDSNYASCMVTHSFKCIRYQTVYFTSVNKLHRSKLCPLGYYHHGFRLHNDNQSNPLVNYNCCLSTALSNIFYPCVHDNAPPQSKYDASPALHIPWNTTIYISIYVTGLTSQGYGVGGTKIG